MEKKIKIIECPRDAMQGWSRLIPTHQKITYINSLLKVGFDTIDFGSFVSPRAIPQMADTKEVVSRLDKSSGNSKLLAIIANERGAEDAVTFEQVDQLGFPFSISETFQQRNTNSSIEESLKRVETIHGLCIKHSKELVVYISMGFGNPYGDPYNEDVVYEWVDKLTSMGISIISLADTVGLATAGQVSRITSALISSFQHSEIGVHLHSTPVNWREKLDAASNAGCVRFDGALKGIGGCPMANDELVGNMNTEWMIGYFEEKNMPLGINKTALAESLRIAGEIFI